MNSQFIENPNFQRSVLTALALEWQLAVDYLASDWRCRLREPVFSLMDSKSVLGKWCPAPVREIRISLHCVVNHPWYAVTEVLRHEMAHQFADEIFRAAYKCESSHGPTFQDACRLLGANPAASGEYPALDTIVFTDDETGSDRVDRIMQRIRKLMALGQSPNRHEAELALAKARELLARYGDELPRQPEVNGYVTVCLGEPALRHGLEGHALATLIGEHYPVRLIWVPMAVVSAGKVGRVLEISGTKANVRTAHYAYEFMQAAIAREWQAYKNGRRLGANGRRDFAMGMIAGFRNILAAQTAASPSIQAMILRRDPQLEVYFKEKHPHRRRTGVGRGIRMNKTLMREGRAVAARVGLRHAVENPPRQVKRLTS